MKAKLAENLEETDNVTINQSIASISRGGQNRSHIVTIPKKIAMAYGLGSQAYVRVELTKGGIVLKKLEI